MDINRTPERRYDLDWLRVFAFTLLILFHSGMMFVSWDWHVKNLETSETLEWVMAFLHQWRMPLLFFISGGAVWFAMERYSTGRFVRERLVRLLVPLLFGMAVIVPPQVYYERLYQGHFYGSFLDFYATLGTLPTYPQGNLSWHHLWYIPYIFVYSLLALPLFVWLKRPAGRAFLARLRQWLARPGALLLLAAPSAASDLLLRPIWPGDYNNLFGDWANFASKLVLFVAGFCLCSGEDLWMAIERYRFRALLLAVLAMGLVFACWQDGVVLEGASLSAYRILRNLNIWAWLLAILGFGHRHLRFSHPVLKYANEAVYPFYILHQTVIVVIGYHLVGWNASLWLKLAVVALSMTVACAALYEGLIRRVNWLRPLFGLKIRRRPVAPVVQAAPDATGPAQPVLGCGR